VLTLCAFQAPIRNYPPMEIPVSISRVALPIAVLLLVVGSLTPVATAQRAHAAAETPRFRLTALPATGSSRSSAAAINEQGEIAGTIATPSSSPIPAFWSAPDVEPQLATGPGADWAEVLDVGASGLVAGFSLGFPQAIPFTWQPGQDVEPVADSAGVTCESVYAINDRDVLVGTGLFPGLGARPALWVHGVAQPLGLLAGDDEGRAYAISAAGHVVGRSGSKAARWIQGRVERLDFAGAASSTAFAVNDRGDAVGWALQLGADPVPVLWRGPSGLPLPTLGGATGTASAINGRSWIVGSTVADPGSPIFNGHHATLWIREQALDLNALTIDLPDDAVLVSAADVNDAGQIVGWATNLGGQLAHAFLLEPVGP
jgi:probable HAF family extracellular repeat protein